MKNSKGGVTTQHTPIAAGPENKYKKVFGQNLNIGNINGINKKN